MYTCPFRLSRDSCCVQMDKQTNGQQRISFWPDSFTVVHSRFTCNYSGGFSNLGHCNITKHSISFPQWQMSKVKVLRRSYQHAVLIVGDTIIYFIKIMHKRRCPCHFKTTELVDFNKLQDSLLKLFRYTVRYAVGHFTIPLKVGLNNKGSSPPGQCGKTCAFLWMCLPSSYSLGSALHSLQS